MLKALVLQRLAALRAGLAEEVLEISEGLQMRILSLGRSPSESRPMMRWYRPTKSMSHFA